MSTLTIEPIQTPCGNRECSNTSPSTYCSTRCESRASFLREFDAWSNKDRKPCRTCGTTKSIKEFRNPGMRHCQACMKVKRRKQYENQGGKDYIYGQLLEYRYGITMEEYRERVDAQNGCCAICGDPPEAGRGRERLNVDHNHETGAVRDLLCGPCNRALANAKDDPARLRAMIDYLERHSTK